MAFLDTPYPLPPNPNPNLPPSSLSTTLSPTPSIVNNLEEETNYDPTTSTPNSPTKFSGNTIYMRKNMIPFESEKYASLETDMI